MGARNTGVRHGEHQDGNDGGDDERHPRRYPGRKVALSVYKKNTCDLRPKKQWWV